MEFGILNIIQRLKTSLQNKGLRITSLISYALIRDHLFDIRYRTDTCTVLPLDELTINSDNKERGVSYVPTRLVALRNLFNLIKQIIPAECVFVDFGCGKGRPLLVASEFGFKEVRGVDFAHELCEIAKKNCAVYKTKMGFSTEFQIIECDVSNYSVNADENVFFMYNPFDETMVYRVLYNITSSLQTKQRKILIIYNNPRHTHIFEQWDNFIKLYEYNLWGQRFIVYSNQD